VALAICHGPPEKIFRISFRKRLHFIAFYVLLNRPKSVTVNYKPEYGSRVATSLIHTSHNAYLVMQTYDVQNITVWAN